MTEKIANAVCRLHGAHDIRVETIDRPSPDEGQVLLRMAAGGICGSDLHYFQDGGFGAVRVREPIILGHEGAGTVQAAGPSAETLTPGTLVSVNPSRPCGTCRYCRGGLPIHCLDMQFLGSAMRLPHAQGLFRSWFAVDKAQCYPMGENITPAEAACTEPLSVCLHAVRQAGSLEGCRVLVTGSGPIGALTVAAARQAGAAEIVATDLQDFALERARAMGASRTVNVGEDPEGLADLQANKGAIDVAFDCSAAGPAIATALSCVKPQGTLVQVGVTGEVAIPLGVLVSKEITYRGSQRFHAEFADAARLIASRAIDVRPIITGSYPIAEAQAAFEAASDRTQACKIQLSFD